MTKGSLSLDNYSDYYMPGEYKEHAACCMIWPTRPDVWRNNALPAQIAFAEVANTIAGYEPVFMFVKPGFERSARELCHGDIRFLPLVNDNAWMRDVGPTFLKNRKTGKRLGLDWTFNAWGGKIDGLYNDWEKDDCIASRVCSDLDIKQSRAADFVLEGGSIHSDGEGTLYTTESCLLHEGRNPGLSKSEIENRLKRYLNVKKIIWIPYGIYQDETNGHVDNICHIAEPGKILLSWTDDKNNPQYVLSQKNLEYLETQSDAAGRKIQVIKLPLPSPVYMSREENLGIVKKIGTQPRREGDRLAASYANFYLANGAVIFPKFNDPHDAQAEEIFRKTFPDRDIKGVYSREILLGGGNIHCITLHIPE